MFMDQAGWHKSRALVIPDNIELAFLPPYAPDLNPQEHIWDELREKYFRNRTFASLDSVMDTAAKAQRTLERLSEKIKSITGWDWILNPY